ncbi:hypothetical protein KIMH_04270 [Bombiscardovia apis]|uniref:Uncharacterized protein n=1 Tax=Bombiscardovia apis TaxID=2932182 RepID=A0ABN6SGD7_9BIFI|nr:hypothetical protein [Bombiscardovia apis]BDR54316.1 hypothetical protein KIMH_04270 [Bombiscardovia apis]
MMNSLDAASAQSLVSIALTVMQWLIFAAILMFGALHTLKGYLDLLQHPELSTAHYVALFYMIPFIIAAVIVVVLLQVLKQH